MIRFLVVKSTVEVDDTYIKQTILASLNTNDNGISAMIYDSSENEWSFRLISKRGPIYFMTLAFNSYDQLGQLVVNIDAKKETTDFDEELHRVKVLIKNLLMKTWSKCVWLFDEQSNRFAEQLYGRMYHVENLLRSFINHIMITSIGIEWWEKMVPLRLKTQYDARKPSYKRVTKDFRNVEDFLLAVDTDHLKDIMTHTTKKWIPTYNDEIESLLQRGQQNDNGRIISLLKSQLQDERNLWDTLFKQHLTENNLLEENERKFATVKDHMEQDGVDFLNAWDEYCSYRNHVAHNKLLDEHAFKMILNNVNLVEGILNDAIKRFSTSTISDEKRKEAQNLIIEFKLEKRMYEQAGVRVLSEIEIIEKVIWRLNKFSQQIMEELSRNDLEFNYGVNIEFPEEEFVTFCTIESKISNKIIRIHAMKKHINEGPGETSAFLVKATALFDYFIGEIDLLWTNGNAEWDSDGGRFTHKTYDSLYDKDLDTLADIIMDTIEKEFKNYVKLLEYRSSSTLRDGEDSPVCDDPCHKCGNITVSLEDYIFPVGKCATCGTQHNIRKCLICNKSSIIENGSNCETCTNLLSMPNLDV
ncbi:hypothetical protein GK047_21710 [Paenibacillus sp. SYP-B3998]|uniref:Apea-like HEPN domain-containing protein n=1 Tax=Paenibacillus sp. SYP-B3998 TaxID=2678564 RepID=A0A6G4A295_9BACL|nr:hypothetical protein [Paenibacillus sp. SYP-B3998]NEW08616.1 hypothetical protein [Paenibacillus sp. SYP-B3998]